MPYCQRLPSNVLLLEEERRTEKEMNIHHWREGGGIQGFDNLQTIMKIVGPEK